MKEIMGSPGSKEQENEAFLELETDKPRPRHHSIAEKPLRHSFLDTSNDEE